MASPLGDALSATFGHDVNRPGLNAFVDQSQARNGLVTAQTQSAWLGAQQEQDAMDAASHVEEAITNLTGDAKLGRLVGLGARMNPKGANMLMDSIKAGNLARLSNPDNLNTAVGTASQAGIQGKVPEPVAVPNNYATLPGMNAPNVQQTAQGAAQTAQTKAVTAEDIARAEELHATAQAKTNPALMGQAMSPGALDEAALTTMANPDRIKDYASFGTSGQQIRTAISNRRAEMLTQAGMTPEDMITQRSIAKANIGSAAAAAKQREVLDAFTPLVESNGQRILDLLDQIDPHHTGNVPLIEGYSRALGRNLGSDDLAELHSVFGTYQNEVARLLSGNPNMTGVISDKARGDVQAMAPENMTSGQASRVINRIHTEIGIRRHSVEDALRSSAEQQLPVTSLSGVGGTPTAPMPSSAPVVNPGPPQGGQLPTGWKVSVQ